MTNPVQILRSNTAGHVPSSLVDGQVAINQADGILFWRNASGTVMSAAIGAFITASDASITSKADASATTTALAGKLAKAGDTVTGSFNWADFLLQSPYLQDVGEVINARGSISGAQTIDVSLGNVVTATIAAATTFTFTNPSASTRSCTFTLKLTNGGAGAITWPTSVKWAGGTAPSLTASGRDRLWFTTEDGGTTWDGGLSGKAFA